PHDSPGGIYACQRLPNGDTFIGECNSGRLLEVAPDGTLRKEIRLLPQGTDGGHAYMRNARKLENGHYLVAHYGLDKVCEYDDKGSLVRAIAVHGGPHSVLGLKNGNILISCSDHNGDPGVIEVNPKGKIVWQLKKDDLPGIVLKFMTGMVVLPNGHLVLTNWLGHNHFGESAHVFEITRRKKVIWAYRDHSLLRTVSNVQLW
ncbi:MAG: hypothetical protein LWW85_05630, partial [Marinilabiliales bacterium]|nr:hypothetical protein [Marinilabiliales bacterium]